MSVFQNSFNSYPQVAIRLPYQNFNFMKYLFKIITLVLVVSAFSLFSACSDDDKTDEPSVNNANSPSVTIEAPAVDKVYGLNDTVFVKAHISHDSDIHIYSAEIRNIETDSVVWTYSGEHSHDRHKHIEGYWINKVTGHSDMELTVRASDHQSNATIKKVAFHCHPM